MGIASKQSLWSRNDWIVGVSISLSCDARSRRCIVIGYRNFPYNILCVKNKIIQVDEKPDGWEGVAKLEMGLTGKIKDTNEAYCHWSRKKRMDSFLKAQFTICMKKVKKIWISMLRIQARKTHQSGIMLQHYQSLVKRRFYFSRSTGMCVLWEPDTYAEPERE